jgi:hypothetical protein
MLHVGHANNANVSHDLQQIAVDMTHEAAAAVLVGQVVQALSTADVCIAT